MDIRKVGSSDRTSFNVYCSSGYLACFNTVEKARQYMKDVKRVYVMREDDTMWILKKQTITEEVK